MGSLRSVFASFMEETCSTLDEYHAGCHGILVELTGASKTRVFPVITDRQCAEDVDQCLLEIIKNQPDPMSEPCLMLAKEKLVWLSNSDIRARIQRLVAERK